MLILSQGTDDYILVVALDSGGTFVLGRSEDKSSRGYDHKATYYVMQSCITTTNTEYIPYTTGVSRKLCVLWELF